MAIEHDPLVAAACASPDEDTPRLVLADWLDDHGQPERAAFIREQCRDHRGGASDPGEHDWLARVGWTPTRMSSIIAPYAALFGCGKYLSDHGAAGGVGGWQVVWRRGFPAGLVVSALDWFRLGDALCWSPTEGRPCPPTACPGLTVRMTQPCVDAAWRIEGVTVIGTVGGREVRLHRDAIRAFQRPNGDRRDARCEAASRVRWPAVRAWEFRHPGEARP